MLCKDNINWLSNSFYLFVIFLVANLYLFFVNEKYYRGKFFLSETLILLLKLEFKIHYLLYHSLLYIKNFLNGSFGNSNWCLDTVTYLT